MIINRKQRQALAKFRCGVAPIRVETGRFVNENINDRLCILCNNGEIENEEHCIIRCNIYNDIRQQLYSEACTVDDNFINYNDEEKFIFLMSNYQMVDKISKACLDILKRRANEIYNT